MSELEVLAGQLYDAKHKESVAKTQRIVLEEKIAELVETGDNGSKTVPAGDGIRVTVKRAMSYKADVCAIRALSIREDLMPIKITPPVPTGFAFDEKAYESIIAAHPEVAHKLAPYVTVTPRKVSVALKLAC